VKNSGPNFYRLSRGREVIISSVFFEGHKGERETGGQEIRKKFASVAFILGFHFLSPNSTIWACLSLLFLS
jgi:hypothetical protein